MNKKIVRDYSFNEFVKDINSFELESSIDTILIIARGGLTLGHFLSVKFTIRNVVSVNVVSYNDNQQLEDVKISNIPSLESSKHSLIVDDISDSGRTLTKVTNSITSKYPNLKLSTFTIFYKETSNFKPDTYLHKTDEWVEFFWEKITPSHTKY